MCLPVKPFKVEREWEHEGLKCAVVLAREGGHRCGYVRVPVGHPAHGQNYNDVNVDVHGGLTFGELEPCAHEDGTGWWFGFDCAHAGDSFYDPAHAPEYEKKHGREMLCSGHYWTQSEVEAETERLAEQFSKEQS